MLVPPKEAAFDGVLYSGELEPISFDDLPLGGEWTTRRRTISDSEIALFTAVAGDFSPLAVDASGGLRHAPPALVVAVAAGLASMDMPIPDVAAWEWQTWKFPRSVRAGDTIYARWTLTQKRAPLKSGRTAIAVWRVDVHTADGTVCAEGEVGASVIRSNNRQSVAAAPSESSTAAGAPAAPARRRRRGRSGGAEKAASPAPPALPPAQPQQAAPQQTRSSSSRRRRRRRTSGQSNGGDSAPSATPADAPPPMPVEHVAAAAPATPSARTAANPLTRVMKRLRGT